MAQRSATDDEEQGTFVSWREFFGHVSLPALSFVCLAVWLHAADALIVATMLPSIVATIGGAGLVSWSIALYEIASVVAGAVSALVTLRYGMRTPMFLAALAFGLGCFLSAAAPIMPVMLMGRVLQGLGGGGLVAMGFVAVGVIFHRRYTARAMAAVSTFWGVSAFIGPLIGSFFVEFATWRWGFSFFGMQAVVLSIWVVMRPDPLPAQNSGQMRLPWRRLALLCLAVLLVSYAGVRVAWVPTTLCLLGGIACLLLFLHADHKATESRLLPYRAFDVRQQSGAALLMILSLTMATIAITALGPLLVTTIHSASALSAGYIVACSSIGWTVMAVGVSGFPEKLDRLMIAVGIGVVLTSVIGFLYAVPNGPLWLIAMFAALEGGGFGMSWAFILRRATALSDPVEQRRISGAIPTVQRLGYALGAAYIGIMANAAGMAFMSTPSDGIRVAQFVFLSCLPLAAVGVMAMLMLVRQPN